jgi:hypothetical protein
MAKHGTGLLALAFLTLASCGGGGKGGAQGGGSGGSGAQVSTSWQSKDVGSVGQPGSVSESSGTFTVAGSGDDIWNGADAFRYVYHPLSGDGELVARVASLVVTDPWTKAGVMIRETLDPDSKFVMTIVSGTQGGFLQYRGTTGGPAELKAGPAVGAPQWVKLRRSGNTFSGSVSGDGVHWTALPAVDVSMSGDVVIGLCVTAHNNTMKSTSVFDSVQLDGSAVAGTGVTDGGTSPPQGQPSGPQVYLIQVRATDGHTAMVGGTFVHVKDGSEPPGNHAPAVSAISASPGSTAPFGQVTLQAAATDADGDALRYAWISTAGRLTGSSTQNETWTAPSQPGTYTLQVMVTDGKTWSGKGVTVQVNGPAGTSGPGDHPPQIYAVTASSYSVSPGDTVSVTANALDAEGATVGYDWYASTGGTIAGSGATISWVAPVAGSGRPAQPGLWQWDRTTPAGCPYPMSTDVRLAFTGRASHYHFSDTWMPTWASDGSLYSTFQDGVITTAPLENFGGFFGGTEPVGNGWAKVVGNDPQDLLFPEAGMVWSTKGSYSSRWPCAFFSKDGVLYYGSYLLGTPTSSEQCGFIGFRTSVDGGHTWVDGSHTVDNRLFPEPAVPNGACKFGQPYMVDLGQNQQHSPDGKVYFISNGAVDSDPDHVPNNLGQHTGDQIYLCRVTPSIANVNDASKYEFYAGNGSWSSAFSAAQPIVDWNNHCGSSTMTYNPALNKFLILTTVGHPELKPDGSTGAGDYDTYMLESDTMTGPWKVVTYLKKFGTQAYYPNLPSKFISGDGRTAWMWYGANYAPFDRFADPPGSGYRLSEQQIRLLRPGE